MLLFVGRNKWRVGVIHFGTLIIDYLNNIIEKTPTISKISLFSDGCGYQNRNIVVSNALLKFSIDHKVTITQNFQEKGQTQMEVDTRSHDRNAH